MSYAIINARRYWVKKKKKVAMGDGGFRGFRTLVPQGYKAPTFPLHHSIGFSSMSGIEYFITRYPMF